MPAPVTIWRFFDGKAGHRNQIAGLTEAMNRICAAEFIDIMVTGRLQGLMSLWPGRARRLSQLPRPVLLVGAGHATHIPLLAARWYFGGKAIVLMKPSLPLWMFDTCLIPSADRVQRVPANTIVTEGALNRIQPSRTHSSRRGLILIGGPSDHFQWSDERVLSQLAAVIRHAPAVDWTLTTSRRTPVSFLRSWHSSGLRGEMVPVDQTGPDWLPTQLQTAGSVWVTNESVSMICEALTSGAAVGILTLEQKRRSRVANGIHSMMARHMVTSFEQWQSTGALRATSLVLDEAKRCAEQIMLRFNISVVSQGNAVGSVPRPHRSFCDSPLSDVSAGNEQLQS